MTPTFPYTQVLRKHVIVTHVHLLLSPTVHWFICFSLHRIMIQLHRAPCLMINLVSISSQKNPDQQQHKRYWTSGNSHWNHCKSAWCESGWQNRIKANAAIRSWSVCKSWGHLWPSFGSDLILNSVWTKSSVPTAIGQTLLPICSGTDPAQKHNCLHQRIILCSNSNKKQTDKNNFNYLEAFSVHLSLLNYTISKAWEMIVRKSEMSQYFCALDCFWIRLSFYIFPEITCHPCDEPLRDEKSTVHLEHPETQQHLSSIVLMS